MKQDEDEEEDEDEDDDVDEGEDDKDDLLLTSQEPFRITKLILAKFSLKKSGYGQTDQQTNGQTDKRTKPLIEMRGRI